MVEAIARTPDLANAGNDDALTDKKCAPDHPLCAMSNSGFAVRGSQKRKSKNDVGVLRRHIHETSKKVPKRTSRHAKCQTNLEYVMP